MEQRYVSIDPDENVARLLCNEWLDDGEISIDAFALAPKETYLVTSSRFQPLEVSLLMIF